METLIYQKKCCNRSSKNARKFLFFIILFFSFCSTGTTFDKPNILANQFLPLGDSIHFYPVTPANFSYQVSSCKSSEFCGQNLFDSMAKTKWVTKPTSEPEWAIIDFGEKRLMNKVEVKLPENSDALLTEYQIQVLKRGEWFTLVANLSPRTKTMNAIGNIDAAIIRVYFPKLSSVEYEIADVKIYLNDTLLNGVDESLTGYKFPVPYGLIPQDDYSLPGAPRAYRNGIHKGIDISYKLNDKKEKVKLTKNDPVIATKDGTVIRADVSYEPMTLKDYNEITEFNKHNRVAFVDKDFGGRQIWIDHGNGVMSSYNHLSSIESWVKPGVKVKKGNVLGKVGNSGLKGEAEKNDTNIHLHFEVWIKGEFLGKGMDGINMRKFLQVFYTE
jgi:murein DD-endopeptidase MepM/ murein hydrolase activator NlpD